MVGNLGLYHSIYELVRMVPAGKVATYGLIAKLVGCGPRQVGYAMFHIPHGTDIPWHRVVNAKGEVSLKEEQSARYQLELLRAEGVPISEQGKIPLRECLWDGPGEGWLFEREDGSG
ncbi:MAG TPA: MGMT family protein [Thermotogota bacterium]|nr:MGMT family protein [Thermotogota bacterium]HRW91798.1 MGMT family protein [Thermotogota bacterium]